MRAKIMTGCLALFISHLSFAEDETVLVINTAPTEFAKSVNEEINKMGSKYHLVKFKNNDSDQSSPLSDYLSLNIGSHTDAIEYIDLVCNKVTTSTRLDQSHNKGSDPTRTFARGGIAYKVTVTNFPSVVLTAKAE